MNYLFVRECPYPSEVERDTRMSRLRKRYVTLQSLTTVAIYKNTLKYFGLNYKQKPVESIYSYKQLPCSVSLWKQKTQLENTGVLMNESGDSTAGGRSEDP